MVANFGTACLSRPRACFSMVRRPPSPRGPARYGFAPPIEPSIADADRQRIDASMAESKSRCFWMVYDRTQRTSVPEGHRHYLHGEQDKERGRLGMVSHRTESTAALQRSVDAARQEERGRLGFFEGRDAPSPSARAAVTQAKVDERGRLGMLNARSVTSDAAWARARASVADGRARMGTHVDERRPGSAMSGAMHADRTLTSDDDWNAFKEIKAQERSRLGMIAERHVASPEQRMHVYAQKVDERGRLGMLDHRDKLTGAQQAAVIDEKHRERARLGMLSARDAITPEHAAHVRAGSAEGRSRLGFVGGRDPGFSTDARAVLAERDRVGRSRLGFLSDRTPSSARGRAPTAERADSRAPAGRPSERPPRVRV